MHREDHALDPDAPDQEGDELLELVGERVAHRVGDVQRRCACLGYGGVQVDEVLAIRAGRVLGRELNVAYVGSGVGHGLDAAADVLLAGDPHHMLEVNVGIPS